MKKLFSIAFAALMMGAMLCSCSKDDAAKNHYEINDKTVNINFAYAYYNSDKGGYNFVFSPVSLEAAINADVANIYDYIDRNHKLYPNLFNIDITSGPLGEEIELPEDVGSEAWPGIVSYRTPDSDGMLSFDGMKNGSLKIEYDIETETWSFKLACKCSDGTMLRLNYEGEVINTDRYVWSW